MEGFFLFFLHHHWLSLAWNVSQRVSIAPFQQPDLYEDEFENNVSKSPPLSKDYDIDTKALD